MRKRPLVLLLITALIPILLLFSASATAQAARHYDELTFPPLPEVQIPAYSRFVLENGMVVYLMENHELPLVGGVAVVRTGDRLEPADKVGLGSITGDVLRDGGTLKHPPDRLNALLEQRAASVESGIDLSSGSVSFSALTENLPEVFDLFAEVIREPAFPQEKLDLAKVQWRGSIARRNDEPGDIADREFSKLIYGASSPYARTVEYATLDKITREDLVQFYQQDFHPNRMIVGIVGDFDSQAMRSQIQQKFGDWKPQIQRQQPPLPGVTQATLKGIFLVDQPQLTQSYIQMGHLGGLLNHPDYAALTVMEGVLSGFGGRLFNQVRSRQGLAYSVYASWGAGFDYPGVFVAGGETRSEATVPFIQSVVKEIDRIRQTPITPQELAYAKDSVLNSFVFNFQQPGQTLSRLIQYEYFGYPQDFLFQYQRGVAATTIADVQRVARTYLQPEKLVTLVVGNNAAIKPSLTSLKPSTPVVPIDITIPVSKSR
ncbi:peptidase M16 [Leptolyngbya sp. 'hensonii']|uniref:M16 family metallopeptidase n=1 Tax=Leptolyngbya sp. 'hensonii' TaxID=1922337 RepID=UPI00094F5DB1|nr:pitrilysin family protein [Leptolyngbya sp. 'hensonii']OLP18813.1 peptidase M16 [Leptolyngbya sp. 'hensonii']